MAVWLGEYNERADYKSCTLPGCLKMQRLLDLSKANQFLRSRRLDGLPGSVRIHTPFVVFKTSSNPLALSNGTASASENIWPIFLDVVRGWGRRLTAIVVQRSRAVIPQPPASPADLALLTIKYVTRSVKSL